MTSIPTFECHLCGHVHDRRDELLALPNVCSYCDDSGPDHEDPQAITEIYVAERWVNPPHPVAVNVPPAPLHVDSDEDRAELAAWMARMANATPELRQLRSLLAAVEHWDRMGWLNVPSDERWKLEQLISDASALVGRFR